MKKVSNTIIYQQGEYLFQFCDDKSAVVYPNCWSFFGGKIEPGETPWRAHQQELEEELGWLP
jgi:8-oxo-dGTP pyrophosphatase MutT (NUDIX family)